MENSIRDRGKDAGCPDRCDHQHTTAEGMDAQSRDGVHYRQVAVDGHNGEKEDAAVEADGEDQVEEFAEEITQQPTPVLR